MPGPALTTVLARRARRPIVARRPIDAPPDEVLRFLGDLENHVRLAPGSVEVLSLDGRLDVGARALVRLSGPLGMKRTAATELLPTPVPNSILGRARIGASTLASVTWRIQRHAAGSAVTLCATIDSTSRLDALLLRFGGRGWLARRFAAALEHLSDQLAAVPAHPATQASPEAPARRAA